MLDPRGLYELHTVDDAVGAPVLVHALRGFMDAGAAGTTVSETLLTELESTRLATFDVDQLFDYRGRRPVMTFDTNKWTEYDEPSLVVDIVKDVSGQSFLLMHGMEPDTQWERFSAAVRTIIEDCNVSLTVGVHGIPMGIPHTRPLGVTVHGTRDDLVGSEQAWFGAAQVPGSAAALLEMRLGEAGHDAIGFAAHVPHYLAQARFPQAAETLMSRIEGATGLELPILALAESERETAADIERQVADAPEVQAVVHALEEQYDAFVKADDKPSLLASDGQMPTADELGAEFERFLAEQGDEPKG